MASLRMLTARGPGEVLLPDVRPYATYRRTPVREAPPYART
ncbi:hypothetical protein ACFW1M_39320 [Streptomyces inhibens]